MPDSPLNSALSRSFNIKDYVRATNDAAKRTRFATIVLVVASVLVFIGFYNSFQISWDVDRLRRSFDPDDQVIFSTLDPAAHPKIRTYSFFGNRDFIDSVSLAGKLARQENLLSMSLYGRLRPSTKQLLADCIKNQKPTDDFLNNLAKDLNVMLEESPLYNQKLFEEVILRDETRRLLEQNPQGFELIRLNRMLLEDAYPREIAKSYPLFPADEFRKELQQSGVRAYVENVRFVRVPFFGIAFDVNDLGLIGGIGFIIILLLLRHCLSGEIKSLKISFAEALRHGELYHFYQLLAVRQVFTVPELENEQRNRFLAVSAKIICIFPALVYLFGVGYDFVSVFHYGVFRFQDVSYQLYFELFILLGCILYLSYRCIERQIHIDAVWKQYWGRIGGKKSAVILLEEDLVEEFGSDDAVNNALRGLRIRYDVPNKPETPE